MAAARRRTATDGSIRFESVEFVLRDDAAYAAFRIFHVSPVAGYDVNVQVRNRLTGPLFS